MNARIQVVSNIAETINGVQLSHPVRVGIDGVDCSGKTTLADELASKLDEPGRKIIRVSIDKFHNCKKIRYRKGRQSPRGYYEDSFDNDAIITCVLDPLGPESNLMYRDSQFDFRTDTPVNSPLQKAAANSILIFDGVFLLKPELVSYWDFTIFVDVGFEETIKRARNRDQYLFGSADEVEAIYRTRYIPGQKIYLDSVQPRQKADIVINNTDFERPLTKLKNDF